MKRFLSTLLFLSWCFGANALRADEPAGEGSPVAEAEAEALIGGWLAHQAAVRTWTAEVTQTRHVASLTRPLVSEGRVWFAAPNRFRWQLGEPPRTIAVRGSSELLVAYPRLRQLERYPMDGDLDPSWRQVLELLEVGFPADREAFHRRYEVLAVHRLGGGWRLELRPAAEEARQMIAAVRLELDAGYGLRATELDFPDGSTLRNEFTSSRDNVDVEEAVFVLEAEDGWDVVEPLAENRR